MRILIRRILFTCCITKLLVVREPIKMTPCKDVHERVKQDIVQISKSESNEYAIPYTRLRVLRDAHQLKRGEAKAA